MVHLTLNDIEIPGNVAYFYGYLMQVASFNVFPTDELFDWLFNFKPSEPVTARFEALGYETKYFVKNMGVVFLVGVIFVILLALIPCLKAMNLIHKFSATDKVESWLYKTLCWNLILRFLIESYILIAISSFINVTEMSFGDIGGRVSSISTIFGMIITFLLPIFVFYYTYFKFDKLKN